MRRLLLKPKPHDDNSPAGITTIILELEGSVPWNHCFGTLKPTLLEARRLSAPFPTGHSNMPCLSSAKVIMPSPFSSSSLNCFFSLGPEHTANEQRQMFVIYSFLNSKWELVDSSNKSFCEQSSCRSLVTHTSSLPECCLQDKVRPCTKIDISVSRRTPKIKPVWLLGQQWPAYFEAQLQTTGRPNSLWSPSRFWQSVA